MSRRERLYEQLVRTLPRSERVITGPERAGAIRRCVDAMWEALSPTGVSWLGFYVKAPGEEMLLEACRDKPACSPIGLHGACGRSWTTRRMLVVTDVSRLGVGYIACDPRDRSEVVVPMFEATDDHAGTGPGACWGVLDVDSFDVGAFDADDARGLWRVCEHAGLTRVPEVARRAAAVGIDVV